MVGKKGKLSFEEISRLLRSQTIMLSLWGCEDKKSWGYQWYLALKKIFGEVILFDPRAKRIEHGPELMKENLLNTISEKKPDYFLFLIESSSLNIETIEEINKLSPKTKTIVNFGDDDINFEERSRYYALFVDYCLLGQPNYKKSYIKDGLNKVFPFNGVNTEDFRPFKLEKKYDVSFIGQPLESRIKLLSFLIKNKVKVNIWGRGWDKYPEFKEFYHGPLSPEDFVRTINQSKINLSFTRNQYGAPHFTGRLFEFAACRAFQLTDYFPELNIHLKENKEIVMFKDERDLLNKTNYYLKNEKEREKIAKNSLSKSKKHDFVYLFRKIFGELSKEKKFVRKALPKINAKEGSISESDLKDISSLKEKIKYYDYIFFSGRKVIESKYRKYLQIYSLEKTKKDISCCSYFIYSKYLGNYMKLNLFRGFERLGEERFNGLLNLNQFAVRKDYLLSNIDKFRKAAETGVIDFISKSNTSLIKIPLVQIVKPTNFNEQNIKKLDKTSLNNAFQMEFTFKLHSLLYQKKIFFDSYIYKLIISSLIKRRKFILNIIYELGKENLRNHGS